MIQWDPTAALLSQHMLQHVTCRRLHAAPSAPPSSAPPMISAPPPTTLVSSAPPSTHPIANPLPPPPTTLVPLANSSLSDLIDQRTHRSAKPSPPPPPTSVSSAPPATHRSASPSPPPPTTSVSSAPPATHPISNPLPHPTTTSVPTIASFCDVIVEQSLLIAQLTKRVNTLEDTCVRAQPVPAKRPVFLSLSSSTSSSDLASVSGSWVKP